MKREYDERLVADDQIGARIFQGARALAMHRMMQNKGKHWDQLSESDKLHLVSEAAVVIAAADKS